MAESFTPRSGTIQEWLLSLFLFNTVLELLARKIPISKKQKMFSVSQLSIAVTKHLM
jgi:hypothetical protein